MIYEIDEALRALIKRDALPGADVEVVFEAPTKDWASRRNAPTVNAYLYDIREDLRRRERGLINEYDAAGFVTARHHPPRHFKLSYLITAWTQRPEDEHRLLSSVLGCFLAHNTIPRELLTGSPAELGLAIPVSVALPPPEDRSFADVWSALGGELKPSLDIVVTTPILTATSFVAGPPVQEGMKLGMSDRNTGSADPTRGKHPVPPQAGHEPPPGPVPPGLRDRDDTAGVEEAAVDGPAAPAAKTTIVRTTARGGKRRPPSK